MLRKNLYYDFLSTRRVFLPLWGGVVLLSIILRGLFQLVSVLSEKGRDDIVVNMVSNGIFSTFFGLFVMACACLAVGCFIILIVRFQKNFYGDGGYLTNILPVKHSSLVFSKVLSGYIWVIGTFFILSVAGLIITFDTELYKEVYDYSSFYTSGLYESFAELDGISIGWTLAVVFLRVLTAPLYTITFGYFCITLGHNIFGGKPFFGFVLSALIVSTLRGIITSAAATFELPTNLSFALIYGVERDITGTQLFMYAFIPFIIDLAFLALFWFVTVYLLSRKLELK